MLPFMKEQNSHEKSSQGPVENKDNTSSTLKNFQSEDFLTVSTHSKTVRKSTTALGVLFAIGILALFFMIKKSSPIPASAEAKTEDAKIEMAIGRLTGVSSEMVTRMDQVVQKFYEFSDVKQVKINELAKDPFAHDIFPGNFKGLDVDNNVIDMDAINAKRLKDLQFYSIMSSGDSEDKYCCMINDKILYEGDEISGFKIIRISENSVSLKLGENEFTLKLEE
ncbi:MAG: hypothetical protein KAS96_09590 [Planctomycetes bacterium]|nr:hypothetical protein [Planctomycetota bacterium]